MLALVLKDQQKYDEAAAEFREAIRLRPEYAGAALDLVDALRRKGDYVEALAEVRKLRERIPGSIADFHHPAEWFAKLESTAALAARLPSILRGEDRPRDVAERLALAQMCYDTKRFAASARFWAEALEADPKLGDDRVAQHRYNAACSAALAVAGQGKDETPPDDAAKADLRRRAMQWLKAELAAWSKILASGPQRDRAVVLRIMQHWRKDPDLATVRDADALAKLPEAERKDWLAFWNEVDALVRKASEAKPR